MLAYKQIGTKHGSQTVVLLHGFCGSNQYWDKLIPLLSDSYRWILPDLRGHGESAGLGGRVENFTMESQANDVAELLEHLEVDQAVLLGHSLGGYIALAYAEQFSHRLAGFGLIHSTALPDDEKGKEGRMKSIQTIKEDGLESFVDGLIPKLFAPESLEQMPDDVHTAKQIGYGTDMDGAIYTLEGMKVRPNRKAVLQNTSLPILLLAGEKDSLISPDKTFVEQGDSIIQKTIAQAGHMSMMETPEQLAEGIHGYLKGVSY